MCSYVAKWLEEAEHIGGETAFCLSFQLETKPIMTLGFKRQYEEIQRSCQKKQKTEDHSAHECSTCHNSEDRLERKISAKKTNCWATLVLSFWKASEGRMQVTTRLLSCWPKPMQKGPDSWMPVGL